MPVCVPWWPRKVYDKLCFFGVDCVGGESLSLPIGVKRPGNKYKMKTSTTSAREPKIGMPATVNRAELPTILASELSSYHAYNPARVIGRTPGRVRLAWPDGHSAWFDSDAVVSLDV